MLTASRPRADHEPTTAWTTACRPRAEPFSTPIRDQAQRIMSGSRAGFKPDDEPITATNYTSSARSTADPELNGAPIRSWKPTAACRACAVVCVWSAAGALAVLAGPWAWVWAARAEAHARWVSASCERHAASVRGMCA